jgi:hypothetical protein
MVAIGRPLTGPVAQVRAWELSCILRAPTATGDVWFKTNAALPLFVNEGVVLTTLAELFGDRVPAPLAVDAERGWMLLDDHGEEVARSYARMQVEAAGQADRLLAAGCHDRRLDRLAAQAEAWLPQVGNVARGPAGYTFFDWTDACVVHPFLDLVTIRRGTSFAEGEIGSEAELRARLRAAYLPAWAALEPPERLDRADRLAAPLGALHQAVSYRSIVASRQPPIDVHMGQSTAWWLRRMLAGLAAS